MSSFPIFKRLRVADYGLYPGTSSRAGIDVTFEPGLTLVLGANGLGKTTLVALLYRMCTGPYDIPGLAGGGVLGARSLRARKLGRADRRLFAERVNDGAETAQATLEFRLGEAEVSLTRSLASLDLTELQIGGDERSPTDDDYHGMVLKHAGVSSFGDWILLLRHLTFYFEERRALVWDPSAQRQILRVLFLAPNSAAEWTGLERDILERDSRMRNLQAALTREEGAFAGFEEAVSADGALRDELLALEKLQAVDQPKLDELNELVTSVESARQGARLNALKAESEHESAYRDLERHQLTAIAAAFPTTDDTARYLIAKLFADSECLACGSRSPETAAELRNRLVDNRCVVCNSAIEQPQGTRPLGPRALSKATKALDRASERLFAATTERESTEEAFEALVREIEELNATVAERSARIDSLVRRLPPDEAELHQQRDDLAALRGRVAGMKQELAVRREDFTGFITRTSREIVTRKDEVQMRFAEFAEGFLLEDCALAWSPHKDRLGETGPQIDFPGFELEMGGADFPSPVRRTGPEQVSESQREFIDLAFRMALMRVAGTGGVGSLVIDAPESSLDAVFVTRASDVLTRFASAVSDDRLIVTSNLIEGDLIPELIRQSGIRSPSNKRIVDLLKVAAPTTATRKLKNEYAAVRRNLFARSRSTKA